MIKIKQKLKKSIKYIFILFIFTIIIKEFINVLRSFDKNLFNLYANELTLIKIMVILFMGIIAFVPLSLYDLVLKNRVGINLDNKKIYKYSWIASSISNIAGMGGSTAIYFKNNFYGEHVKDKKLLVKETSKFVALNLTGFSIVSLIYAITSFNNLKLNDWIGIMTIVISLYFPLVLVYLIYKYIKGSAEDKSRIKDYFKIILMSAIAWLGIIVLIYSIILILKVNISFTNFFPVFMVSIIIAMVSMSPGGLGSFDLTMIVGLQRLNVPVEKTLLAIFLYRVSYYIVPLIIGLVLYAREFYKNMDEEVKDIFSTILSKLAHISIVLIVLVTGSILLLSEAVPVISSNVDVVKNISYLSVIYIPNRFTVIIGFLLIVLSRLLIYKSKYVYKATLFVISALCVLIFIKGTNYSDLIYILGVLCLMLICKNQFYRESFVMGWRMVFQDMITLIFFLLLYVYTFHSSLKGKITKIAFTDYELRFSDTSYSIIYICIIGFVISILFLVFIYYINSKNKFPKLTLNDCKDDVDKILDTFGGTSVSHFIYLNDKYVYINKEKDVLMQYQTYANKIYILGNPVGNKENIFDTIQEFYELSNNYGYICVFCAIDKQILPYLHETGYQFFKLGEEATVNLKEFTLEGRKMKSVRNAISRVTKEGYSFQMVYPPFDDNFFEDLKNISDQWLDGRKEKGFSIGFFNKEYLSKEPICVVRDKENNIKGFANIMPMYDNNETLSIDLMRFSRESCNGIMDFMFVNLFEYGKEHGYSRFNMGMVPLSNVGRSKYAFLSEKIAAEVYSHGHKFYSFKGLKKYKEKYCESWDGRYLAYKKKTSLVSTMIQVILLVSKPYDKLM
ncbi:phosphatidylglycerol lysyltransferase [Terrisporobacter glycolicus]|nr:phosphatidylglycerol lysyltransferase [Terrisporobacter glycolicus]